MDVDDINEDRYDFVINGGVWWFIIIYVDVVNVRYVVDGDGNGDGVNGV